MHLNPEAGVQVLPKLAEFKGKVASRNWKPEHMPEAPCYCLAFHAHEWVSAIKG